MCSLIKTKQKRPKFLPTPVDVIIFLLATMNAFAGWQTSRHTRQLATDKSPTLLGRRPVSPKLGPVL